MNVKEDGSNPIRHKNLIPVTSGMEYKLKDHKDGTYTLEQLTIHGKKLEDSTVYVVSLFGDMNFIENPVYCNCPMPQQLKNKMEWQDISVYTEFCTALEGGKQMEKPSEYITVLK